MTGTVRYRVEHVTHYVHREGASTSLHIGHLRPRTLTHQRLLEHAVTIDPEPVDAHERPDYFGNSAQYFSVLSPYSDLDVTARSVVEVDASETSIDPEHSPSWERVRDGMAFVRNTPAGREIEFSFPSPYVDLAPEVATFARGSFRPGWPLLASAMHLMHRIHRTFTFDPDATSVTTPVARVLALQHGVCQDFAHLQIACLRAIGLAARYVSGYLLTDPPTGQVRLVGADASHAWLSVFCPHHGWVDLDPTNDVVPGVRHITLAWGRDYGDVSPLRGVVLGGGEQTLRVGVNVMPIDTET